MANNSIESLASATQNVEYNGNYVHRHMDEGGNAMGGKDMRESLSSMVWQGH